MGQTLRKERGEIVPHPLNNFEYLQCMPQPQCKTLLQSARGETLNRVNSKDMALTIVVGTKQAK